MVTRKLLVKMSLARKPLLRTLLIATSVVLASACVEKTNMILPTQNERMTLVNLYKRCVANATNSRYDASSKPEEIVSHAMEKCDHAKNTMLSDYPKSWRAGLVKKIDDELYKREIAWVESTRSKNQKR